MNDLHLFAGIGGGILGGLLVGNVPVCAVELDPYCRSVLVQRQNDGHLPIFPITLEIVNVRCERLNDMSLVDVHDEGYNSPENFIKAWDSLNSKRGFAWDSNPWVWVIEFKKVESEVNDEQD